MRKLFVRLLERLTKSLKEEDIEIICQTQEISTTQVKNKILPVDAEESEKKPASKSKKKNKQT